MPGLMKRAVLLAGISLALGVTAAQAATVVAVSLWDKGAAASMPTTLTYGAPGLDMSQASMGIKAEPATAKAGVVTFHVTNTSKDTVHEMIVMYLADPSKPLPYLAAESRVDEDKAGDKGEVSELDPGASGSLTVALKPGKYLLICNVPGHFAAGMWTQFEVTK
ncbi:MAG TPA: sulfocyanin-like copper-binding protein [Devosia sp.]|nr:sulfocyanin-like copper-binding protein [Devosia sp.]